MKGMLTLESGRDPQFLLVLFYVRNCFASVEGPNHLQMERSSVSLSLTTPAMPMRTCVGKGYQNPFASVTRLFSGSVPYKFDRGVASTVPR